MSRLPLDKHSMEGNACKPASSIPTLVEAILCKRTLSVHKHRDSETAAVVDRKSWGADEFSVCGIEIVAERLLSRVRYEMCVDLPSGLLVAYAARVRNNVFAGAFASLHEHAGELDEVVDGFCA